MLIIFEGLDGSGKTTQMEILAGRLRDMGHMVHTPREPGGTELGETLRPIVKGHVGGNDNTPMANALMFNAGRNQLYTRVIEPALEKGEFVLLDRSKGSTLAYQGYGDGLNINQLEQLCHIGTNGREADITLFVDIPLTVRAERLKARAEQSDAFEDKPLEWHERVREGYLKMAQNDPDRWNVIDGTGTLEEVTERIWDTVQARLALPRVTTLPVSTWD